MQFWCNFSAHRSKLDVHGWQTFYTKFSSALISSWNAWEIYPRRAKYPANVTIPAVRSRTARPWAVPETALGVAVLAYAVLAAALGNAPLQDLPNHLTRAHVIADLLWNQGAGFAAAFQFKWTFSPYLSGDLLLAACDWCLGREGATRLWIGASIIVIPWSVWFLLRVQNLSRGSAAAGALLAFYIATDWSFVTGFINYQMAIGGAFFAYGWYLKAKAAPGAGAWLGFVLTLLLGYSLHLSALIFVIAMVGTSLLAALLKRQVSVARAATFLLPPFLLLVAHFALSAHGSGAHVTNWGTVFTKLRGLTTSFRRFGRVPELLLFLALLGTAIFPVVWAKARSAAKYGEDLLLGCAFLGLYLIMPIETGGAYNVDIRAVPFALMFFVFVGLRCAESSPRLARAQLGLAFLLACINLALLAYEMVPQNAAMGRYKALAAAIPASSVVLPIDTLPAIGRYEPFSEAGAYATLLSGAVTPYIFAADKIAHMPYFRLTHPRPYSPCVYWYTDPQQPCTDWYTEPSDGISWERIQQEYRYLLVTVPWDPARIPLRYSIVKSNDVAALLQIAQP